jgi:hypothetical protein
VEEEVEKMAKRLQESGIREQESGVSDPCRLVRQVKKFEQPNTKA